MLRRHPNISVTSSFHNQPASIRSIVVTKDIMRIVMERRDFASIPTDELWSLHEKIASALFAKLTAEISEIENRLNQLDGPIQTKQSHKKPAGGHIRLCCLSLKIQLIRRKLGRVEESNLAG